MVLKYSILKKLFSLWNPVELNLNTILIHDPYVINEAEGRKCINGKNISEEFLNDSYEIQDLEKHKVIQWLVPIKNETGDKQIGKIACCAYPGFEMFRKTYYGNLLKISELRDNRTFIGRVTVERSLYTVEMELNEKKEIFYPWEHTDISYTV